MLGACFTGAILVQKWCDYLNISPDSSYTLEPLVRGDSLELCCNSNPAHGILILEHSFSRQNVTLAAVEENINCLLYFFL
jgi:hypothetical protein